MESIDGLCLGLNHIRIRTASMHRSDSLAVGRTEVNSSEFVVVLNKAAPGVDADLGFFVLQLLPVANFFQLRGLQRCCEATLSRSLTPDSAVAVYQTAKVRTPDRCGERLRVWSRRSFLLLRRLKISFGRFD